jgi:type I restriction enzyme S subunit
MKNMFSSEQWVRRPLGEVAKLQRGFDLPVQDREIGDVPIFAANGPIGVHSTAMCKGPGVVTGRSGTIGKVHYVSTDYWPLNTSLFVVDFCGNHPKWVYYMLSSFGLEKFAQGAGVPTLNRNLVHSEFVWVPPFEEQQRIATILDKVESLCRKRQEAIRLANEFLRAVFLDIFGDLEINPKSFAKGTIRDLVSSANYGTSEKASEHTGQYPILRMNNITYDGGWNFSSMKYVDLDEASAHKYLTKKGDLLFNRTNSKELVGKTAVYMRDEPMAIAGYLVRVRMNERGNAHYVSGYLNSAHGKRTLEARAKSIVGMANINAQEMQDIPLLLPPIELQNKFAGIVEAVQERLIKQHDFSREAEALRAALSEKFFSQIGEKVTEPC